MYITSDSDPASLLIPKMGGTKSLPQISMTTDRVVLITGANTGIGYEAAKWIAMMGARVIIACRSEERAKKAIEKMQKEFEEEKSKGTPGVCSKETLAVEFMELDLASFKSVESFVKNFKAKETKLHLLLCNAGIALHEQEYTEDGFEIMFQVNYLGHFLLVTKLLPTMLVSGDDCRVILVSSLAHQAATFDLEKAQGKHHTKENFKRLLYYGNSKLYQELFCSADKAVHRSRQFYPDRLQRRIMQMYCLNRRLQTTNVTVNCVHPGVVETEIDRSFPDLQLWKMFYRASKLLQVSKTPFEGAKTLINAAVKSDFKDTRDAYYIDMSINQSNSLSRDKEKQEALWQYSLDCLKEFLKPEDLGFVNKV